MRRFRLMRHVDHSGVSNIGHVAEGVEFSNGWVALYWYNADPGNWSVTHWQSLDAVLAIHGHGGDTVVEWVDAEPS